MADAKVQIKGIDISRHQGEVNWEKIYKAYSNGEISFVILRAGYGGGRDSQFIRNRDAARARAIPRQFYFFAYPGRSSGTKQAEEFYNTVGPLQPGESVSLDMEDEASYGRRLVSSDVQWALDFLKRAQELFGVKPLIYMNSDVLGRFDWKPVKNEDYGLWIANYGSNNGKPNKVPASGVWDFWAIWQYTSKGSVAGISPVDVNIFSGSKDKFLKYGYQGASPAPTPSNPPAPTPTPSPVPSGNKFTVTKSIRGYYTGDDALHRRNPRVTVKPGEYVIFNRHRGMLNVTRQAGSAGSWINPGDLGGASPAPKPSKETHIIVPSGPEGYLGNLAKKYGTSIAQIVTWNKGKYPSIRPDYVQAGWKIRVR